MSLYSRHVLPRLIDAAMSAEEITRLRQRVIPGARGVVVEIGIGSGLNLPIYPAAVSVVHGVDSSAELLAMARLRSAGLAFRLELLHQTARRLPYDTGSADTAVVTWSLCSIDEPEAALSELYRVLKPGGALVFVEHGLSPDAGVRTWQDRLTPVWRRVAGGCHLNRRVDDLIRSAGFAIAELQKAYIPGPRVGTYMYSGRAEKPHGHD